MKSDSYKKRNLRRWLPFYVMGLPGLVYLFINNYMPLAGLQIAFKNFNYRDGMWGSKWNGLKNFEFLFKTSDAWIMIRNTLLYNIVWIILGIVIGISAAILLNEILSKRARQFYQTIILLPHLMSMVVIAYLAYAYLATSTGLFNKSIIEPLGGSSINWYAEPKLWPFILTFINQWKSIGFGMVLYLSSIVGIDKSFYEAAEVDGATKWQQIRKITLPLIKPTVIMLLILQMGQIFRSDFGLFYQVPMNQGALFSATKTIDTYVYRALLERNDIRMSSAASFIQSIVGFIFIVTANKIVKRVDQKSSLF